MPRGHSTQIVKLFPDDVSRWIDSIHDHDSCGIAADWFDDHADKHPAYVSFAAQLRLLSLKRGEMPGRIEPSVVKLASSMLAELAFCSRQDCDFSGINPLEVGMVGMGATIVMWSDRHAATIVKVTRTQIHVQQDNARRIDGNGVSIYQEYEYTPNPKAKIIVYRKTKRGYRETGGGSWLRIGEREEYYDPDF